MDERYAMPLKKNEEEKIIALAGDLTFTTVTKVFADIKTSFKTAVITGIDLSQVKHSDSAGLALLLSLLRDARHHHCGFHLYNIPNNLFALAQVVGVDKVLLANGSKMG